MTYLAKFNQYKMTYFLAIFTHDIKISINVVIQELAQVRREVERY